jgi:hypothetical protein
VLTNERFYSSKKKKSRVNVPFPLLSFFFFFFFAICEKARFGCKGGGLGAVFFWGREKSQCAFILLG